MGTRPLQPSLRCLHGHHMKFSGCLLKGVWQHCFLSSLRHCLSERRHKTGGRGYERLAKNELNGAGSFRPLGKATAGSRGFAVFFLAEQEERQEAPAPPRRRGCHVKCVNTAPNHCLRSSACVELVHVYPWASVNPSPKLLRISK